MAEWLFWPWILGLLLGNISSPPDALKCFYLSKQAIETVVSLLYNGCVARRKQRGYINDATTPVSISLFMAAQQKP